MLINIPKTRNKSINLIKPVIFSALIIFISVINNSAQFIRIEAASNDTKGNMSVCGRIENEQLTIPSYKFKVTDKNGITVKNLRGEGELFIEESVWTKNGFFDFDPYWKTVNHNVKIPIVYDSKEEVYISQEIPKIKVAKRKKGGVRLGKCLDKITKLEFSFYQNDCDSTGFIFFFPNRNVDEINLPSAEKIYNLGIITGYSCAAGQ